MLISILPPPTSEILYNILVRFAAVMFAYITLEPGTVYTRIYSVRIEDEYSYLLLYTVGIVFRTVPSRRHGRRLVSARRCNADPFDRSFRAITIFRLQLKFERV